MGSGLRFLNKRGKPRTIKKKNKVQSVARKFKNKHVTRSMLDDALSPVLAVYKKDYGVNIVLDDGLATVVETPAEGNWQSFQCLPGRQCYMEFNALPFRPFDNRTDMTLAWNPSTCIRPYSFIELLYNAWRRSKTFAQVAPTANTTAIQSWGGATANPQYDTTSNSVYTFDSSFAIGGNTNDVWVADVGQGSSATGAKAFVEGLFDKMIYNFNYAYLGGYQEHTFVNTTTLPVHGELVEYWPRQVTPFVTMNRKVSNVGVNPAYDVAKIPGLYHTLYRDQMRKNHNSSVFLGSNVVQGVNIYPNNWLSNYDYSSFCDEIDDKGFKYDIHCDDTNFLWKVGKKVPFTVYPGQKFVYKMILPPFSGNSLDFVQGIKRRSEFAGQDVVTTMNIACVPGFSKGVQIRMWGSPAYKRPSGTVHTPAVDTFAANNVVDRTSTDNAFLPGVTQPHGPHTTHGVRMTHHCVEYHRMRTFPAYPKNQVLRVDRTANAADKTAITVTDNMANIDPLENQEENVAGNHV